MVGERFDLVDHEILVFRTHPTQVVVPGLINGDTESCDAALASLDATSLAAAIGTLTPAARRMLESEDAREGPLAFAEKRAPRWSGR